MPKRIQRRRAKGWRMPENAVSVTRPGRFGNPYPIGKQCFDSDDGSLFMITGANCLPLFRHYAEAKLSVDPKWLEPLRNMDLACFCNEGAPCHGDVLIELANR